MFTYPMTLGQLATLARLDEMDTRLDAIEAQLAPERAPDPEPEPEPEPEAACNACGPEAARRVTAWADPYQPGIVRARIGVDFAVLDYTEALSLALDLVASVRDGRPPVRRLYD